LDDNSALEAAVQRGGPIVPVYVWSPQEEKGWPLGAASRWWLHHSLASLEESLKRHGLRLILRIGTASEEICKLCKDVQAEAVSWNQRWEPAAIEQESNLQKALVAEQIESRGFASNYLFEPSEVLNKSGGVFKVFTPFYNSCLERGYAHAKFVAPNQLASPSHWPKSCAIEELDLLPKIDWDAGLRDSWEPGEAGAQKALISFADRVGHYLEGRNRPDIDGVSRLSPHLHFGEIGPRQIVSCLKEGSDATSGFLRQLIWREFSAYTLFHFPETPDIPLDKRFKDFPWEKDQALLVAWQKGRTGYPLVDAGLRQLWHTGYMHNRIRMVVASFLVKDLMIPWQDGSRWFWDTLVDADLANNTMGWQWTSGCGVDPAPYFRIFNPVTQGEKFDPDGDYVRQWVPELKELDSKWIHRPWDAPLFDLEAAGIKLGETYPLHIIEHDFARKRALKALLVIKQ
jgi:deoxyribodipyrimidine photo-lyase